MRMQHFGSMEKLCTFTRAGDFSQALGHRLTASKDEKGTGMWGEARADLCECFRKSKACKRRNGVDVQLPFSINVSQSPLWLTRSHIPPYKASFHLVSNSSGCISMWAQSSVTKTQRQASAEHT